MHSPVEVSQTPPSEHSTIGVCWYLLPLFTADQLVQRGHVINEQSAPRHNALAFFFCAFSIAVALVHRVAGTVTTACVRARSTGETNKGGKGEEEFHPAPNCGAEQTAL